MQACEVTIVGAGVVGIACALSLQRAGLAVTVVDRGPPAEGCSKGNAGVLAFNSVLPLARPGVFGELPTMLSDPLGPLVIRWPYLPQLLPWLIRFLGNARQSRVEHNCQALASLALRGREAWERLLVDTPAGALVRRGGWLSVFENERTFEKSRPDHEMQRRLGIDVVPLSGGEVRDRLPAISETVARGVLFPSCYHTVNPHRLVTTLAEVFQAAGGELMQAEVAGVRPMKGEGVLLDTDSGELAAQRLIVAAGAWSGRLAAHVGDRIPLDTERGYHAMLPNPGVDIDIPVMSVERKIVTTPMQGGLRLAGTVELAGLERPPDYSRGRVLIDHSRRLWPGLDSEGAQFWMGCRPTLPDSLPVLGRSPREPAVIYAFGHHHLGLTLAAVTSEIVRNLVIGTAPAVDLSPFRAQRF
jgi:D-amino-acid dehydrogenase